MKILVALFLLTAGILAAGPVHALEPLPGPIWNRSNSSVFAGTITSGGGVAASSANRNLGVIGQITAGNRISSTSYRSSAGLIPPLARIGALTPVFPILGVTPGNLSFVMNLRQPPAAQLLSITNSGAGTLTWSTSTGQSWLTLIPGSGTNAGSVSVGVNPLSLMVGNYQDTITVSASGARNPLVYVPVTLTVNPVLTVNVSGTGGGQVNSDINFSCAMSTPGAANTCTKGTGIGDLVTLMATPDSSSTFTGWSGACTGTSPTCTVTMGLDRNVTAAFVKQKPVRIDGATPVYYDTLQAAYDAASSGAVIQLMEGVLQETLIANRPVNVKIRGGYNASYTSNAGAVTVIRGKSGVRSGTVVFDRVKVR